MRTSPIHIFQYPFFYRSEKTIDARGDKRLNLRGTNGSAVTVVWLEARSWLILVRVCGVKVRKRERGGRVSRILRGEQVEMRVRRRYKESESLGFSLPSLSRKRSSTGQALGPLASLFGPFLRGTGFRGHLPPVTGNSPLSPALTKLTKEKKID